MFTDIISVLFEGNVMTGRHFCKKTEIEKNYNYSNSTYIIRVVAKTVAITTYQQVFVDHICLLLLAWIVMLIFLAVCDGHDLDFVLSLC